MLGALHGNIRAQYITEHVEFRATETLTGCGRGADRAMIFQQQKALGVGVPFGHVAFARTDLCQARHTGVQSSGAGERGIVGTSGFVFAHAYELFQCRLAERRADRVDETDGELGVRVREAIVPRWRQVPMARRPTDTAFLGHGFH
jgi:hypothetical protein